MSRVVLAHEVSLMFTTGTMRLTAVYFEKISDSETYTNSSSSESDWADVEEDFDETGEAGGLILRAICRLMLLTAIV